tara:strand:+ start:943 stop:1800 length:858 start_codon:yes stop_codon:yes gene_type:complete
MLNEKLTILIILYEEKLEIIKKCLNQIKDFKIIIIDNANDINLKNEIVSNFKIYKYLLNKKNIGFSKAANQGILESDTEYLMLLGADCLMAKEDIQQLIITKKKYKDCFFATPTFYDADEKYAYNGGPLYENAQKNEPIKNQGDVCVEAALTTTVLFKVKDIKDIGLFDEEFFLYFLDDDLCRRVKGINKSIIQVFESKAIHTHGQLKIKNKLKKIFFRNYYFDYEELYYLYKNNLHKEKYLKFKNKIPKFIFKMIINFLIIRPEKFTYYLAKILAFNKFSKFIK